MAYLAAHGEVLSRKYTDSRVVVHCRLPKRYLDSINEKDVVVEPHANEGNRPPEAIEGVA